MSALPDEAIAEIGASTGGRPLSPDRPLLVFIHAAGMDHTEWQLQVRYFASHGFSVLAVDLPGHGATPGPPPESIGGYATWVAELIERLGVGGAHLVGHSMGAAIALSLAASRPDLVKSLVLMSISERLRVNRDLLDAAKRDDHLAVELMASWCHAREAHLGGHCTPGLWMRGATTRLLERATPGLLYNDLAACDAYEGAVDAAAKVECETLYVLGDDDVMTRASGAVPLIEATQWSQTVHIPGAGHLVMIEQPDAVIDAIAGFLGRPFRGGPPPD